MAKHLKNANPLKFFTPCARAWLYRVLTALIPLLIAYGVLSEEVAPLWAALGASVLGTTTALAHTPKKTGHSSSTTETVVIDE